MADATRSQTPLRRGWRSWWRTTRTVVVVGVLVVLLMAAMTVGVAIRRYNAELTDAARELRTVDVLLAEETERTLQSVELVLDNVTEQIKADGVTTSAAFAEKEGTKPIYDVLRARVAGVPQLDAVTIIAADGKLINFSRFWPVPEINLADRAYFQYLRDHAVEGSFLSEPVVNRGSGTPTVYLARRVSAPDGTFLGLVLGAVELAYFDELYAKLHIDKGDAIALWRKDGLLLARYPAAAAGLRVDPNLIAPPAGPWRGIPGVAEHNNPPAFLDNEPRLVASEAAGTFPLLVTFSRGKSVILSDWVREVIVVGTAVTFAAICIALMMWALIRRYHAFEAVAAASLERETAVVGRQHAEDALRQAQKMEAVGQLTGGVAHDFNNLLTVVRSSVDLLRRPNLSDERRKRYVDAIDDATERASRLTAQLLAFARRQALQPAVFNAVDNVAAMSELIGRLTGSRVQIETRLPDTACFVEADPNQFDTALVNLAVNARDAMENGGRLTISVRLVDGIPAVRSHPAVAGAFVALIVADTGTGIASEMLDRVFEPFFTTKRSGEGTGLGLSQVFGFAKQSGGEVSVESVIGQGTTFTLFLPQASAQEATQPPDVVRTADTAPPDGRCVLVVEDNEQVGRSTLQTLAELGYDTFWAVSAEAAIEALQEDAEQFDIVFSDVVMEGMTGIELAQWIRERHPALPVVLTSGYSLALAEQGPTGFALLPKPYAINDLARVLQTNLPLQV